MPIGRQDSMTAKQAPSSATDTAQPTQLN